MRTWFALSLFLTIAFESAFPERLPWTLNSSPFFRVFASNQYKLNREFTIKSRQGYSKQLNLHEALHFIYGRNRVLGTIVWHEFKFGSFWGADHLRATTNNLFCDPKMEIDFSGVSSGDIESVAYKSNDEGLSFEQRCPSI